MHMMGPAMLTLSANLHGHFLGLLRSRRSASQRKYFIGVIVLRFRGKIRPGETLNGMLPRRVKNPWWWRWLYAGESLISRQPIFLSFSMILASQGKSKQARAILLGQIHAKQHHMRPCNCLDTQISFLLLVSHCSRFLQATLVKGC